MEKKKLLLHACCAPCSIHSAEELSKEYDVTLFFHNPQIFPATEYAKRLDEAKKVGKIHRINVVEADRDYEGWHQFVEGLDDEPEGGSRCERCFEFNLEGTAKYAKTFGYDLFSTTLTISPHKDFEKINSIGRKLAEKYNICFLEMNLKKNDGFLKSSQKSRQHNIYRQSYCGCRFSLKRSIASPKE